MLKDASKDIAARLILKTIGNKKIEEKSSSKLNLLPYKTGATQDEIAFEWVKDGLIYTKDHRYVSIIEVLPLNFDKKTKKARVFSAIEFGNIFKAQPLKLQIKIMNDIVDINSLIKNINENTKDITDPVARKAIRAYIQFAKMQADSMAMGTRYFIIFEHEGEASSTITEVVQWMYERRKLITDNLEKAGNIVIKKYGSELDDHLKDILYYFYNRTSSFKEARQSRHNRISADIANYNSKVKKEQRRKHYTEDDIAPKGLQFVNNKYVFQDGYYYGWLGLKTQTYPRNVELGWFNHFSQGPAVDIDVHFNLIPKSLVEIGLKGYKKFKKTEARYNARKNKEEQYASNTADLNNANNVSFALKNHENLYNMSIIITLRADTALQLGQYMRQYQDIFKSSWNVKFEESDLCVEDYYLMTTPLLYFTKPWKRIHHNILSNQIASIYPFTNYQFYDPNGIIFGQNKLTTSLMVIDIFNSGIFNNANMLIAGIAGSGKTFFLNLLLERYYFNGAHVYSIIPKKGDQWQQLCDLTGGEYYKMQPGQTAVINIMAIKPEQKLDTSKLSENVNWNQTSLLSKKINSIVTWLKLLTRDVKITDKQETQIKNTLVELYKSFGINNNNASIWESVKDRKLKYMPMIGDMYNAFASDPALTFLTEYLEEFVTGEYKNFNSQTTINENSRLIAFDCNEDIIGEKMLPAVLYMIYDWTYSSIKDPSVKKGIIAFDECWTLLRNVYSAAQIDECVRIIRGYSGSLILASQQVKDFYKLGEVGEDIIDNCAIKILLKNGNLEQVKNILRISSYDCDTIAGYSKGDAMFITLDDKIELSVKPSKYEYQMLKDDTSK